MVVQSKYVYNLRLVQKNEHLGFHTLVFHWKVKIFLKKNPNEIKTNKQTDLCLEGKKNTHTQKTTANHKPPVSLNTCNKNCYSLLPDHNKGKRRLRQNWMMEEEKGTGVAEGKKVSKENRLKGRNWMWLQTPGEEILKRVTQMSVVTGRDMLSGGHRQPAIIKFVRRLSEIKLRIK